MPADPGDIIDFWFHELTPKQWWVKDEALDASIGARFGALLESASKGELFDWRGSASGRLAEIIVLDQFSRNIHRGKAQAFANDPVAIVLAQEAVRLGIDREIEEGQRSFLYMPYMHSESRRIHAAGFPLFEALGPGPTLNFARSHKAIIDRFGRYPHRNAILGRETTAEEAEFLQQPNSSF